MTTNALRHLPQPVRNLLAHLDPASIRVVGSALLGRDHNDVDVVVEDGSIAASVLLARGKALGVHPLIVSREFLDSIQDLMTWRNCCVAATPDGMLVTGRPHLKHEQRLVFNPASLCLFHNWGQITRSGAKLEQRGFILTEVEKHRVALHHSLHRRRLDQALEHLGEIVERTLGDAVLDLLDEHSAVVAGGFLRDELDGRAPKDLDVFIPARCDWTGLCDKLLGAGLREIQFNIPPGGRVNLRKFVSQSDAFGHDNLVLDVIDYGFIQRREHVVETFDFAQNMLWFNPSNRRVRGSSRHDAAAVVRYIQERQLVVGDNLWYRAGMARALKRWQRFVRDGYVADPENIAKYRAYLSLFGPIKQV